MLKQILCVAVLCAAAARAEVSALWGQAGERWTPQSRLPDFSFAGYHRGEAPLPTLPPGVSVKTFGAKGDGESDDTQAFLDAIAQAPAGAIEIPEGRYKITQILEIRRPGIVLRGAGPEKTVLFCPVPLQQIRPNWSATTSGQPTSNYSWSGGIVWFTGSLRAKPLAAVAAEAARGATTLTVDSAAQLQPGQTVQVTQNDQPSGSLAKHLYSGDPGEISRLQGKTRTLFVCRITAVNSNQVQIDRPLRCDIRPVWNPKILAFAPTVTESGIENLSFEFPNTPYLGHFTEPGFNAMAFNQCADCWARNIRVVNADSGVYLNGVFCTAQGIVLESARTPDRSKKSTGHHGVSFGEADNLLTGFDIRTRFIHDVTVDSYASGNVAANGKGEDLCLDHHKRTCYENLFVHLDAGAGTRLWACGGGANLGRNCAARGTFWNIRAARPLSEPPAGFGPWSMNFVALQTAQPSQTEPEGKWWEVIAPEAVVPQDIHQAQLERRLKEKR